MKGKRHFPVRLFMLVLVAFALPAFFVGGGAASGWNIQTVDFATQQGDDLNELGYDTSLDFDAANNPHISYYDEGQGDLKYATWEQYAGGGGHWLIERVDYNGKVGKDTSIDVSGNVYISYYDDTNKDLKFAKKVNGVWTVEIVDNGGGSSREDKYDVGEDTSLMIDSAGNPHISYYSDVSDDLKYAVYVGSGGNCPGNNKWKCTTVDSSGSVGRYTSLVLDGGGMSHVSYYDKGNGNLKYATEVASGGNCGSGKWQCSTIDNSSHDVGEHTSIAMTSDGYPIIAYEDESWGDLKVACLSASGWNLEVIAGDGLGPTETGEDASIKVGGDGHPRIAFHNETTEDLMYAMRSDVCGAPGAWTFEDVDTAGNQGEDNSLALKSDDTPCISYHDESNGNLKYACAVGSTPPDVTNIQPSGTISTTSTTISADYSDNSGTGINTASVAVYLDGTPVSGCVKDQTHTSCDVTGLGEGGHTIDVHVTDNAGNHGSGSGNFTVQLCHPGKPSLTLVCATGGDIFWASYQDYLARDLSVRYTISNPGASTAYSVAITGSTGTNGATINTAMPKAVGTITGGSSAQVTLKYIVPMGVHGFTTTTTGAAADACGTGYTYPT